MTPFEHDDPEHESIKLPENIGEELAAAFGTHTPSFDGKDEAPTCCQLHLVEWLGAQMEAGRRFTQAERALVAKGMKQIAATLREERDKENAKAKQDPAAANTAMVKAVTEVDGNVGQILAGLLETGDDPIGDLLRGVLGLPPEDVSQLKPGFYFRRSGVRLVTEQGTLFLPVHEAIELAGRTFAWLQEHDKLTTLFREYALAEAERRAQRGGAFDGELTGDR